MAENPGDGRLVSREHDINEWMRTGGSGKLTRRELSKRAAMLGLPAPVTRAVTMRSAGLTGAAASAFLTARGAFAQDGAGGIINLSETNDSKMGNPILVGGRSRHVFWTVHGRLVNFSDFGEIVPEIAQGWEYNEDGTQLSFTLDPDATFHDGEPVTSADVLFTFDKIIDPDVTTDLGSRLQVAGETVTWSAPDAQTVVITTPEPFAPFLANFVLIGILPKHLLENSSDFNEDPYNQNPIGCGPWRLVEWDFDVITRLEPFEDYHLGRPAADALNLVYQVVEPALLSLESGEVDIVFTPPESQGRFEENPDFVLLRYVFYTPITLSFNFKHPVMADPVFRQAVRLAINKDELAEILTRGRNERADNQYAAGGLHDRFNDYSLGPDDYDPDQARALLDEAGYVLGDNGLRSAPDGAPLSFPMLTYAGFDEYRNALEVLQQVLREELGIQTQPEVLDYDALLERWTDPEDDPMTRPWSIEEYPHPLEQDPDVYNELHSASIPPSGGNYNYVSDAEIDRLIDDGRTAVDDETRITIYHQLDARRREVIPAIPLYLATDGWVFSARIQGYDPDTPSSRWLLRSSTRTLYKE